MTYVGRFSMEKDIYFLVEALKRAPENVTLALVGDGPLGPELTQLGKEQAPKLFCEAKFVGREEVALSLAASDIGVSASCMETVGFSAWESIACGTPFLAADALGFHEHLKPGVNSRLWTPKDTEAFDEALKQFIKDKEVDAWDKATLRESVKPAHIPDCTERAVQAYGNILQRNFLSRMLLTPFMGTSFIINSIGERLLVSDIPQVITTVFSLSVFPCMYWVLPLARVFQPVCTSRVSMWAVLSASTAGAAFGARNIMGRLTR